MASSSSLALCIPAYNAAAYLPTLLYSAQHQKIPFDEILVYNDCSTDNTAAVASTFGVKVIEGDINRGCSSGKNRMAEVAKSEWLHFHDADDDLLANFTEVAHKWINKQVVPDVILMHYHYKTYNTNQLLGEPNYDVEEIKRDPVKFNITDKVVNFAVIRKTSFLNVGGFNTDPDVLYNEDRAFYTRAAIKGLTFDYEQELTCVNYYREGSMSAKNMVKCAKASLHVWKYVIAETKGKYSKEIAHQLLNNATYAATADAWSTVRESIATAKGIFPDSIPIGSRYFKFLYRLTPYYSFYFREKIIRHFTSKRKKTLKKG